MREVLIRKIIARMGARYDADMSYQLYLIDNAPKAFSKFGRLSAVSAHRESVPSEAAFTVKLVGSMAEDCGPCTQLFVQMARENGMASDQIEAVLRRDIAAMSPTVALAYRYGEAVLARGADVDDSRAEVRARWGEKGVIDLAMAILAGRLYPMAKNALGYGQECRSVTLEGRRVDVVKPAV